MASSKYCELCSNVITTKVQTYGAAGICQPCFDECALIQPTVIRHCRYCKKKLGTNRYFKCFQCSSPERHSMYSDEFTPINSNRYSLGYIRKFK